MKYEAPMNEEELIKKLKSVKLPDIEMESHQRRLKMALLNSYAQRKQEVTFLEMVKVQTTGVLDKISGALAARRPVWKVMLTSVLAVVIVITAFFSIPQTSAVLKSTFFPEGTRVITGPQLTAAEQKKATDILMADPGVREILAQGAVIDKILPIYVHAESINPATGVTEPVNETWAQAWLVLNGKDWGVQIDLVRGQVISISN